MVAAKFRIAEAAAGLGAARGVLERCLPPTPRATMNEIMTGIHIILSYLKQIMNITRNYKQKDVHQFRTLIPQKDISKEMIAIITIPTLEIFNIAICEGRKKQ